MTCPVALPLFWLVGSSWRTMPLPLAFTVAEAPVKVHLSFCVPLVTPPPVPASPPAELAISLSSRNDLDAACEHVRRSAVRGGELRDVGIGDRHLGIARRGQADIREGHADALLARDRLGHLRSLPDAAGRCDSAAAARCRRASGCARGSPRCPGRVAGSACRGAACPDRPCASARPRLVRDRNKP